MMKEQNLISELDVLNNKLENKITSFSNLKEEYNKKEHAKEKSDQKYWYLKKTYPCLLILKKMFLII